ncbi:adenylosuccinate lyase [Candidatus Woesearchaeota archaeon CG10_big_fil_rev_8_21_14_0_10_32_24]|nr:MAG: adenylosuccinate lyase [Candidatus Woesearchaeota archaeon CG10_big_fil_rev_8_21_14_0_10_32_24]
MHNLEAINPIDGRYRRYTEPLAEFFSEKGLMEHRLRVEGEYLLALSEHPQIGVRPFSNEERGLVRKLYDLSLEDAEVIKAIEVSGYKNIKATNHDVKAVEYYMKDKLQGTSLEDSLEWIHFALTSEDVNNIAYGLMLSGTLSSIILPVAEGLQQKIYEFAERYAGLPMLARTHGQPASPTTLGKEFKVFASRMERQLDQLKKYEVLTKLNGATGNYNAHHVAYPNIDWIKFSKDFIEGFNEERIIRLKPNLITTQIEPHDTYAELFDNLRRFNMVGIDFAKDVWQYISDQWIIQKPVDGEVGSSTMPNKINPIDFENCWGNLGKANADFNYFSTKLPESRLQRDLSDSTVERNFGVALGYCLIGYKSALKGMKKISVDEAKVVGELNKHPEVIAEAIQTILRRESIVGAYEQLKEFTRGRAVTQEDFERQIEGLHVSDEVKKELKGITPTNYIGLAKLLVEMQINV